jgi:hypothetical protein
MSESNSLRNVQAGHGSSRRAMRDALLLTALLLSIRAGQAVADEKFVLKADRPSPDFGSAMSGATSFAPQFVLPATYQVPNAQDAGELATQDFRPRRHSVFEAKNDGAPDDQPMLHGTTVWQRLKDFRSHGRVCLLTLWETGSSSVSLQAGKKGEPSLQWTSHAMNRGGATRGVFDQLFSTSIARASRGMHAASAPAAADRTQKPADSAPKR